MRVAIFATSAIVLSCLACDSATTAGGASAATAPDLSGTASQVTLEAGYNPFDGYRSQYDVWLTISPDTAANAGVVIGSSTLVFLESTAGTMMSDSAADIHTGDQLQIWRDATVAYGAVQAPPGAPAYSATKVVILR